MMDGDSIFYIGREQAEINQKRKERNKKQKQKHIYNKHKNKTMDV